MKPDVTTTIQVQIQVRGKRRQWCGKCLYLSTFGPNSCDLFEDEDGDMGVWLTVDSKGRALRCLQCLAAEVKP